MDVFYALYINTNSNYSRMLVLPLMYACDGFFVISYRSGLDKLPDTPRSDFVYAEMYCKFEMDKKSIKNFADHQFSDLC